MRRIALVVALSLGVAALSAADGESKLDGSYTPKSGVRDGEEMPADELKKVEEVVIKAGVLTFRFAEGKEHTAKIKTDAAKKPAHIDVTPQVGANKDATHLGIYKLEKGELTLVVAREGDRPKDFEARGKGVLTVVLQRKRGADK